MSVSRQRSPKVRSYSITHPPGIVDLPTQPGWAHVIFAPIGLFTAHAADETWTVPRHRALCVGDGATVRLYTTRRTPIRCLYVDAGLGLVPHGVRIVTLSPLGRELLAHAVATAPFDLGEPKDQAVLTVLADQIDRESDATLALPLPSDPAARAVATAIMTHPSWDLAAHLAAGLAHRRTTERRFRAETAMTLGQWRRRSRILSAMALLSDGVPVTQVAFEVGYSSSSSFIAAFRAEMGRSPRQFSQP